MRNGSSPSQWTDTARQLTMAVDIWYPATTAHRGEDLVAATMNTFEVVLVWGDHAAGGMMDAAAEPACARRTTKRAGLVVMSIDR